MGLVDPLDDVAGPVQHAFEHIDAIGRCHSTHGRSRRRPAASSLVGAGVDDVVRFLGWLGAEPNVDQLAARLQTTAGARQRLFADHVGPKWVINRCPTHVAAEITTHRSESTGHNWPSISATATNPTSFAISPLAVGAHPADTPRDPHRRSRKDGTID